MSLLPLPSMLVVVSDRVCLPSISRHQLIPAAIRIDRLSGRILRIDTDAASIAAARSTPSTAECEVVDVGRHVLMSGLVDTHVHCNEPGRTDWEGLETATKAAAAGGVTTIVDMPLNSIPPTTTMDGLRAKEKAAEGKISVDLGLWGGIVPTNLNSLADLAAAGVCGFKCFLIESGVDEFPCVSEEQLQAAMTEVAAKCPSLPVLVHAEACAHDHKPPQVDDPTLYKGYLESRPPSFETDAIQMAIEVSAKTGARLHVVHLSAADAIPLFEEAKKRGLKQVSTETCPHYLTLDADSIPAGATAYKCAPPIREKSNQALLWHALKNGTIPMIVSDHSPCEPALKKPEIGDFQAAWGGISSLQLGLPLIFTELKAQYDAEAAEKKNGGEDASSSSSDSDTAALARIVSQIQEWMSAAPARFVHFDHRKGSLAEGMDADLVVWDPDATVLVQQSMIQHRHKLTPYLGRTLYGAVRRTFVRGQLVFAQDGEGQAIQWADAPRGQRVYPKGASQAQAKINPQVAPITTPSPLPPATPPAAAPITVTLQQPLPQQ